MSELNGQMDLNSFLDEEQPEQVEGYDENGVLMDYVAEAQTYAKTEEVGETTSSDLAALGHLPLKGKAFGDEEAQTPADLDAEGRLRVIVAEVRAIEEQVKGVALSGAVAIGKRLLEAKGLVPHGRWGEWLRANVDYSERRAQDLMRLFETYGRGTIPDSVSALDYSKAVALLYAPEEAREQLAARAVEEDMSVRQLQDEVKRLKEAAAADQLTIAELEKNEAAIAEERDKIERLRMDEAETARRAIKDMERDMNTLRGTADAANRTVEALRKERDRALEDVRNTAQRASDAVSRANETRTKLTEAEAKIKALEAREPERVEVVPPEIEAELQRLRSAAPRGEAEVRFRLAFSRLGAEFKAVQDILAEVVAEDPDKGAKYAAAVAKACANMIQMLGVEA